MLKKIQHKELRIKNFSLASRFLAFSSLSSCIAGKRDNLPLSLDALKSKAGVSLKKKKYNSKLNLYKLPPNSTNLAEIFYGG